MRVGLVAGVVVGVVVGVVRVVNITDVSAVCSPITRNTKVVRPSRIYIYLINEKVLRFPYKHCKVPFVVDSDVAVLVVVFDSSVDVSVDVFMVVVVIEVDVSVDVFMVVVVIEVDVPRLVVKGVVARMVVGGSSSEMGKE